MSGPLGFDGFREMLENMTPDYKKKLIENYQEFGRLRSFCEAKGMIEILPQLQGVKVLKKTKEVKQLKKVVDFLKPGRFKWIEKGKDLLAVDKKKKYKTSP